jgi:hypothetical protein
VVRALAVNLAPIPDSHHDDEDQAVLNVTDDPEVAYPILPELAEVFAAQRLAEGPRVRARLYAVPQEAENATSILTIDLAEIPRSVLGELNAPSHGA